MRILIRLSVASIALILLLSNPLSRVSAEGPNDKSQASADQSSRRSFGVAWKTVNADCASYIRRTLHA